MITFDQLGLRIELLKAIEAQGYTAPTPIQEKAVPVILSGQDILARAQTGTGKTDAFALPLIEILSRQPSRDRHPRALIMTPTRELALQVGECIKNYARRVSLRCTVVHGGININPQIDRLRRGIDILVGTPGRLLDLAMRRRLKFSQIEFLVFDEADRMLDLGFHDEISEILQLLPSQRRTMLFSATYTQPIRDLAAKMLKDPEYIEVTPEKSVVENIVQKVHLLDQGNKRALLIHLIINKQWNRVLVFCRTKHGANKLTEKLAGNGIHVAALHSNKSQSFRTRTLREFKNGDIRILVATDVAARGLDISDLPYVINYDMPSTPEDYVHRIGRTGRAGESGVAISFVSPDERRFLKAIEKFLKQKIPVEKVDGFTEDSDVPSFVLMRPNIASSERKADKAIKKLVKERETTKPKQKSKSKSKSSKAPRSSKGPQPPNPRDGQRPRSGKKSGPGASTRSGRGKQKKR